MRGQLIHGRREQRLGTANRTKSKTDRAQRARANEGPNAVQHGRGNTQWPFGSAQAKRNWTEGHTRGTEEENHSGPTGVLPHP